MRVSSFDGLIDLARSRMSPPIAVSPAACAYKYAPSPHHTDLNLEDGQEWKEF
jgi:hypothetical protein